MKESLRVERLPRSETPWRVKTVALVRAASADDDQLRGREKIETQTAWKSWNAKADEAAF